MEEGRPVWLLGTWSEIPLKARIVKVSDSGDTGGCAEVEFIYDGECIIRSSNNVLFEDLYETKDDIIAAMFETVRQEIIEIKSSIRTKEECIRFLYNHNVSCAAESDWAARCAVRDMAKERWGIDLELEAAAGDAAVSEVGKKEEIHFNKASENLIEIALAYAGLYTENEKIRNAGIGSATWKQMFVDWANGFEAGREDVGCNQKDYLEEIGKYAQKKILEYAGLDG